MRIENSNDHDSDGPLPKLVVFDLDGTLWSPEMYELWGGGAPFKPHASGDVTDRRGVRVRLLGNSRDLLLALTTDPRFEHVEVAISSKTDEPDWAQECLRKIVVGTDASGHPISMKSVFHYEEIEKSSKALHFQRLRKKTGVEYSDMIFYDNEMGNVRTVGQLGVHSVYVPEGMTERYWNESIRNFRQSKNS